MTAHATPGRRRFDAVMFDLDGTLLDTLSDIASAGNHVLAHFGRPTFDRARYRYLAGQGAPSLVREALGPEHQHLFDDALAMLKAYQLEHGLDQTRPYDGIEQLLDTVAAMGLKMAVLSNKPHRATELAVRTKLARWHFDAVLGHRDGAPPKPDPAGGLAIAEQLGTPPQRWLYLGDTAVDMQTACNCGMFAVGCLWGFRDEPELRTSGAQAIVRHPSEVGGLIYDLGFEI